MLVILMASLGQPRGSHLTSSTNCETVKPDWEFSRDKSFVNKQVLFSTYNSRVQILEASRVVFILFHRNET